MGTKIKKMQEQKSYKNLGTKIEEQKFQNSKNKS
jgi:hypothetical protein